VLRGGARDTPQRHHTLHAVIDWSWNLLDPAGQAAMRAVSVFPGGFTADAARHLLGGNSLPVLEQLADQSLLKVADTTSGTRYRMLETVREFAAARRQAAGETERVTGRFLAWARDFCIAHHDSLVTFDDLLAFDRIRAEQDNLAAALRHALDHKDAATVAAVSGVLGGLWMVESSFARLTALAADMARILAPFRPEPALVEATRTSLVFGAMSSFLLGGPSPARFLVGLRRLAPAPPDTFAPAAQAVLAALAGIASYVVSYGREAVGDLDGALAAARRTLAAFERRGDVETGLRLWQAAAAALWDPRRQGHGGDLPSLESWALEVQAFAVVAHAQHGRLDPVREIADALPAALAALTADPGPSADTPAASYPGLSVWGSLLLALAMADLDRARRAGDKRAASWGARTIALAGRFGFQYGFPTMSAARARRAGQDADGPAYAEAVSAYAGLGPQALPAAARAALAARVEVSG
jgi:hypothetical protein